MPLATSRSMLLLILVPVLLSALLVSCSVFSANPPSVTISPTQPIPAATMAVASPTPPLRAPTLTPAQAAPSDTPAPSPAPRQLTTQEATRLGKGTPQSIAWSPDGRYLALSGTTGIYIYDSATWQVIRHIDASRYDENNYDRGNVGQVVFHPDGNSLYFVLIPRVFIYHYDLESEQVTLVYQNMAYTRQALAIIAPGGASFAYLSATCSENGNISCRYHLAIHEMSTGEQLHSLLQGLSEDDSALYAVRFSRDGKLIAAASADGLVRLWDAASGALRYEMVHDSDVYSLDFSPDGTLLASASEDATVRFWDTRTGQNRDTLRGFDRGAQFVAYLPTTNRLLVGLTDGAFSQWSLDPQGLPLERQPVELQSGILGQETYIRTAVWARASVSPDEKTLVTLSEADVRVWELATGKLVTPLPGFNTSFYALAYSPDGRLLAVGDRKIHLWDVTTQQFVATLSGNNDQIASIIFRPDGRQIAATGYTRPVQIFDVATRRKIMDIDTLRSDVIVYSPDGKLLAAANWQTLNVWDAITGELKYNLDVADVRHIAFHPNGTQVFLVRESGVYLWDLTSAKLRKTLALDDPDAGRVVMNLQQNLVAVEFKEGKISFFDLQSGAHLYDFLVAGWTTHLTFSPDGRLLARETSENLFLFDSSSGQTLLTLPANSFVDHFQIKFSPDGQTLVTGDRHQNNLLLWDISSAARASVEIVPATATPAPTRTPSASPQPWLSATPTALPPVTIQPVLPPTPQPGAIRAENAGQAREQQHYGLGHPETAIWSPDSKTLAIGGLVGIYLFTGASQPDQFFATQYPVLDLAISPDGRLLAAHVAINVNSIQVWEIRSGNRLYLLDEEGACQQSRLVFGPDSRSLTSHCSDGMLHQWDLQSGKLLHKEVNTEEIILGENPDHSLALIKQGANFRLIDTASREILKTFKMGWSSKESIAFSPDGKTLLAVITDEAIKRWASLTTFQAVPKETQLWQVLPGQPPIFRATLTSGESLSGFSFSSDSRWLATASAGGRICIWETATGKLLSTTESGGGRLFFAPDGSRLLALNPAGKVQVWGVHSDGKLSLAQTLDGFGSEVDALVFLPDGKTLFSGSARSFQRWALDAGPGGQPPTLSLVFSAASSAFAIQSDGKYLAVGGEHGSIEVWDAQAGTLLHTLSGHPNGYVDGLTGGYVGILQFRPGSAQFASGGADRTIRLWDAETGQLVSEFDTGDVIDTHQLSFSPDGRYLAATNGYPPLQIWDLRTGQCIRQLYTFSRSFVFHPDGVTLAISEEGEPIRLIDIRSGDIVQTLPAQFVPQQIIIRPDGALLAAINISDVVLWDLATGKVALRIEQANVSSLAFSPDGSALALGFADGTIKIWGIP